MTTGRGRRWPQRVYGAGEEPDPRFTLANERTFLAWIRTSLALLAAAVVADTVVLQMPQPARTFLALVLALTGLLCAVQAWRGWARTERALRHRQPLPGNPANIAVMAGTALVAIALVVTSLIEAV